MVVENIEDQHTMVAADKSRTIGTKEVPTVLDPAQAGGVRVVPEAGKTKPPTASIVAERVTRKASVGRRRPTPIKTSWAKHRENGSDHTSLKARTKLEWVLHL